MKRSCYHLLAFLILTTPIFSGVVENGLQQIPYSERCLIREFVKLNFYWHQVSNVCFFINKPCCLSSAFVRSPDNFIGDRVWTRGFELFSKYEKLFPHPNFIFVSKLHNDADNDGFQTVELFIFNKSALRKCLTRYSRIFINSLGSQFSYDWLVSEIEKTQDVKKIIKDSQILLGILLGYGYESSKLFSNHSKACYSSLLISDAYRANYTENECPFFPVAIMGNHNSKGLRNLLATYEEEIDIVWNQYKRSDPLVFFLKSICNEEMDSLQKTFMHKSSIFDFCYHVILHPFLLLSEN